VSFATVPPQPIISSTPTLSAPTLNFYGINFGSNDKTIFIQIFPKNNKINQGKPILIEVLPGKDCQFGDQRACISAYRKSEDGNVIFITVHSGIGGEAETFRRAIEGLGLNQPAYTVGKAEKNLAILEGARVKITQGKRVLDGLIFADAVRVPPTLVKKYFTQSVDGSMEIAAELDLGWQRFTSPDQPVLVFETCGWKMPAEPWAPGVSRTTGSVYLGVIWMDR